MGIGTIYENGVFKPLVRITSLARNVVRSAETEAR
jgi:hypothetical protein